MLSTDECASGRSQRCGLKSRARDWAKDEEQAVDEGRRVEDVSVFDRALELAPGTVITVKGTGKRRGEEAACAKEGACNFTTIGGLLELLGQAERGERGVYRGKARPSQCL